MWFLELFVIGAWLIIIPVSAMTLKFEPADSIYNWVDTASVVLVEFNENMSTEGLRDVNNYRMFDKDSNDVKIYNIGIVNMLDGYQIADTSLVALITEKLLNKNEYNVIVSNVKDKSGNLIGDKNTGWFYFNGYVPNKIPAPIVDWDGYNKYIQPDTALASSQENVIYIPIKAIDGKSASDGDMNSRWTASPLPQWWYCVLNESVLVKEIQICFNYFDAGRTYTYDVEYSNDGINWNKFKIGVNSIPYQEFVSVSDINIAAKYWKILFTGNDQSNWAGLWEVRIIGN